VLNGKFTDVPTKRLITQMDENAAMERSPAFRAYMSVLVVPRYAKTVMNLPTVLRNFLTNYYFNVASGEALRPGYWTKAWPRALQESWKGEAELEHLMEIGLVGLSAHGAELSATLREAFGEPGMLKPETFYAKVKELLQKGGEHASHLYAWCDNIHKIAAYYSMRDRGMSEEDAVKRCRDLFPYYDMTAQIVTRARRWPFVPDFLAFKAEILRCGVNNWRYAVADAKKGDLRALIGTVLAQGSATSWGIGLASAAVATALSLVMKGDYRPPEDEEEHAMRVLLPEYKRTNSLAIWQDPRGEWYYLDYGYIQPYDPISATTIVASGDAPVAHKIAQLRAALWDEVAGAPMGLEVAAEIMTGRNQKTGKKIVPEGAEWWEGPTSYAEHLRRRVQPSAIMYGERAWEARRLGGEVELATGEVETVKSALAKMVLPARVSKFDPSAALEARARELSRELQAMKVEAGKERRRYERGRATYDDLLEAELTAEDRMERLTRYELAGLVDAAWVFLGREAILKALRDGGFSKQDAEDLMMERGIRYRRARQ